MVPYVLCACNGCDIKDLDVGGESVRGCMSVNGMSGVRIWMLDLVPWVVDIRISIKKKKEVKSFVWRLLDFWL